MSEKDTKPDFQIERSKLGQIRPINLPKFEVFGHLLIFESLDLSDFAYCIRQT